MFDVFRTDLSKPLVLVLLFSASSVSDIHTDRGSRLSLDFHLVRTLDIVSTPQIDINPARTSHKTSFRT